MESVLGYIAKGKEEGARLLCGGERLTDGEFAKGAFVAPTVFTDCTRRHDHRARRNLRPGDERS